SSAERGRRPRLDDKPSVVLMKCEKARLQTFSSWTFFTDPQDLAQAGFFSMGWSDLVQCFCCGGQLSGRNLKDDAWDEHSKSFPQCSFILGHNVENVPLQMDEDEEGYIDYQLRTRAIVDETPYPRNRNMKSEEARLETFSSWPRSAPVRPRDLAQAGLFYLGKEDKVECFSCGGKLSGWEPGDTPWNEHEKHFSHCFYILGHDVGNVPLERDAGENEETVENPLEELEKLRQEKRCKICLDENACIVFIPCGHLASCKACSNKLNQCPICCAAIAQKIRTFIA
uniref:E3 ubiquitin-protein ligase XIAP n=1 Tax=Oryzias latipes TaxID=8090 RepID=A0A3P9K5G1_ORYLA